MIEQESKEVSTYPISKRKNLVTLNDLIPPGQILKSFNSDALNQIAKNIVKARQEDRPVIWMMGAHVFKAGHLFDQLNSIR